jgi:hypothetical protein
VGHLVTIVAERTTRRALRALRWYPRTWRERYGEEFAALMEDELDERPRSVRRTLDVARGGLVARAAAGGLAGVVEDERRQARASLAWLAGALAVFLAVGLAMWSQLVVGWQWTAPRTAGTTDATVAMSLCALVLAVLAAVAAVPVLAAVVASLLAPGRTRLVVPLALVAAGTTALVVGARRFENGWPGTGGHHWSDQGLVPGGAAAFVWASTLGVTAYWAHPNALHAFPRGEVVWMLASPVAIGALVLGVVQTLRTVELTARVARFELRLGLAATATMAVFLFGTLLWLTDDARRPRSIPANLFHVGAIDVVGAVVMALALAFAARAAVRGAARGVVTR